jgi:hypothetical protein
MYAARPSDAPKITHMATWSATPRNRPYCQFFAIGRAL